MSTTRDKIPLFRGTLRERLTVVLVAPVLLLACIWCFRMIEPALGDTRLATPGSRLVLDLFYFLCTELFGGAIVFLMLAIGWAIFCPKWMGQLLILASHHVWKAVCLILAVMFIAAFIGGLLRHIA